jgi:hypothetical protein
MSLTNMKPFSCKLLIFFQLFLGIGAVFGGVVLVISPSGKLFNMPITLLEHSPFTNFLIPGIILFFILGVIPIIIGYGLLTGREMNIANKFNIYHEKHWSWSYSLYIGFALIIWIVVQAYIVNGVAVIHLVYIAIGLTIQVLTLLPSVQKYYTLPQVTSLKNSVNVNI